MNRDRMLALAEKLRSHDEEDDARWPAGVRVATECVRLQIGGESATIPDCLTRGDDHLGDSVAQYLDISREQADALIADPPDPGILRRAFPELLSFSFSDANFSVFGAAFEGRDAEIAVEMGRVIDWIVNQRARDTARPSRRRLLATMWTRAERGIVQHAAYVSDANIKLVSDNPVERNRKDDDSVALGSPTVHRTRWERTWTGRGLGTPTRMIADRITVVVRVEPRKARRGLPGAVEILTLETDMQVEVIGQPVNPRGLAVTATPQAITLGQAYMAAAIRLQAGHGAWDRSDVEMNRTCMQVAGEMLAEYDGRRSKEEQWEPEPEREAAGKDDRQ